ncbi:isoflavone reductase family protein-like protein CipA [Boeremia exigua]|uniref:isoflavone reductase family protein-like protein CipA n=1 Tax=Boeremia exigua TaxID=749465 RepID=UPI001E8CC9E1|nr:isoflavone reductase family protein-like protein CipA [Boeremia exigua]KAH6638389.1 isoflavone reductase family protein-like protein CipA [Boeremia exigua]
MSSKVVRSVALGGASGSLGAEILTALLQAKFMVTAIVRKEGQTFPAGVDVKVVNTDSVAEIAVALHGQDAFVDATSGVDPTLQGRFIEAAVSSGVYRIVMGEFSVDPQNSEARSPLVFQGKNKSFEQIKELAHEGSITYTTISNGAFLDWNLRTGFVKIDIYNKRIQYLNDGLLPFAWTQLSSVGAAVAKSLEISQQTENRSLCISNIIKSQREMADLAKRALGEDGWEEETLDMDQKLKEATADMMAGKVDMDVIGNMILWSTGTIPSQRFELSGDNELLGVDRMTDEDVCNLIRKIAAEK